MRFILFLIMLYVGIYIFFVLLMFLFFLRYVEVYFRVFLEDDCIVGNIMICI